MRNKQNTDRKAGTVMQPRKEFLSSAKERFQSFYRSYHKAKAELAEACELSKKLKAYGSPEVYSRWAYTSKNAAELANDTIMKLQEIMEDIVTEVKATGSSDLNWNKGGIALRGTLFLNRTNGEAKDFDFLKDFYMACFKSVDPETETIQSIPAFYMSGDPKEDLYHLIQLFEEFEAWRRAF